MTMPEEHTSAEEELTVIDLLQGLPHEVVDNILCMQKLIEDYLAGWDTTDEDSIDDLERYAG